MNDEQIQNHAANMISMAPGPIFSGTWDHRPSVSSPLSSSPVRASSPLSPIDRNATPHRQTQSSPIQPPKFKFATRPVKPNPVVRKREDAQEMRRKNFLQSVRQKAEDKAWQRRDVEGFLLKKDVLEDIAQFSRNAPTYSDADIEDAMSFQVEESKPWQDDDAMMDDFDDAELEAMIASYEEEQAGATQQSKSASLSDDDYDEIFASMISQNESSGSNQPAEPSEHMELADEDFAMLF